MSPLMHAAFKGNADLVELLLAHGADPNSCHHKDQVIMGIIARTPPLPKGGGWTFPKLTERGGFQKFL